MASYNLIVDEEKDDRIILAGWELNINVNINILSSLFH